MERVIGELGYFWYHLSRGHEHAVVTVIVVINVIFWPWLFVVIFRNRYKIAKFRDDILAEAKEQEARKKADKAAQLERHRAALTADIAMRQEAEAIRAAEKRQAEKNAADRAFWASPEGQKVRAEQMLANIRLAEQEEALKMARQMAEEEEARKVREFDRLKEL